MLPDESEPKRQRSPILRLFLRVYLYKESTDTFYKLILKC